MAPAQDFAGVASAVQAWLADGRRAALVRPLAFAGFSSRRPLEALAVSETGEQVGEVLGPAVSAALARQARQLAVADGPRQVVDVSVADEEAVEAGLACGGVMTVSIAPAGHLPALLWSAAISGLALAVVTARESPDGALIVTADGTVDGGLGDAHLDEMALAEARRALQGGRTQVKTVDVAGSTLVVDTLVPTIRMIVVGGGDLAVALEGQAGLLGWQAMVASSVETVEGLQLGPTDAMIVLSHDPLLDTPALAAALASPAGYVGALGSRHTQAGRRERLLAGGVDEDALGRIRGPAGLDLGSRTPAEIALAISAEILALRSGRLGGALRDRAAPINA